MFFQFLFGIVLLSAICVGAVASVFVEMPSTALRLALFTWSFGAVIALALGTKVANDSKTRRAIFS